MLNQFLKAIIAVVLLSAAYFVYLGVTNKNNKVVTEIEVNAPAEVVYDFITDVEKSKLWLAGLQSVERISGEDLAVGSVYKVVFQEGKHEMTMTETITEVVENRKFAFDLQDEFLTGHIDIELSPLSGGATKVREVNTYGGNHFMARAMTGLFKRSIRKGKKQMYTALKEAAEAG